jgi:hypothetical protein
MRKLAVLAIAALALVAVGVALAKQNWSVHLTGDQENPPRVTDAHGQASFHLSKDGTELRYKLNVARIENVFMAHIHCGAPPINGPITVWLYPSTEKDVTASLGGGRIQGRIAAGTITEDDVIDIVGDQRCPGDITSLADLVAKMNSGEAYVNVHTNDGVAPTNTGPGDFPGGEIRGNLP